VTFSPVNAQSGLFEPIGAASRMGRREIFLWIALALLANEVFQLLDAQSAATFITSFETQNYVLWLAGYAFVYRLWRVSRDAPADNRDFWFAGATCLAILVTSFLPHRWGIGIVASTTAVYFLSTNRGDKNLKAAGALLFAMSAHLVWGPIFFMLVTPEVVRGDAAVVAGLLKMLRPDIIWSDTTFRAPDGHALVLVGACSSFQNISTALLACATVTMLTRPEWIRRDILIIALATLAMIAINTARLCLLAWDHDSYEYWHNGDGANMFLFAQTVVVLLIAWWGAATGRLEA
jgi:exosortase/archaeosortase family protein